MKGSAPLDFMFFYRFTLYHFHEPMWVICTDQLNFKIANYYFQLIKLCKDCFDCQQINSKFVHFSACLHNKMKTILPCIYVPLKGMQHEILNLWFFHKSMARRRWIYTPNYFLSSLVVISWRYQQISTHFPGCGTRNVRK